MMLLKYFYDPKLAQASYLVGCAATGQALVVDPNRDVDQYVRAAEAEGVRITHVTETHIHADFVSGTRELVARTGATPYLSDEGDAEWKYAYARQDGAVLLNDRDPFLVGNIRVEALHTPGHTPEHLSFMITDTAATDQPMGVFTGDFVFVADVGRPDLLEKAAKVAGTMEASARILYRSLQRFKSLPEHLQIWPGHGAGSACGKSLGAVPQSTLGYERIANWGLEDMAEDQFVARVLAGQPEPPRYFAEMKRINKQGPRVLGGLQRPPRQVPEAIVEFVERGGKVIDIRSADAFATGHIPGTINIPSGKSFSTWAGWLMPYDRDFHLLVDDGARLDQAVKDLAMIGLERIAGYVLPDMLEAWTASGRALETTPQMTVDQLAAALETGRVSVVDVRDPSEWESGHISQVPNVPLGYLEERLGELPKDRPLVVHCQGGGRSAIAASVLQAHGIGDVINLNGGLDAWERAGNPTERGATAGVGA
jgi:hydroxyacylglutathione hydrolase